MKAYIYPGFDKLEPYSKLKYSLPLCDILRSLIGDRDYSYLSTACYPLELTELILQHLKYDAGIDEAAIEAFSEKYLTEDSLCPIDELLDLWGMEKFSKMIEELQAISCN